MFLEQRSARQNGQPHAGKFSRHASQWGAALLLAIVATSMARASGPVPVRVGTQAPVFALRDTHNKLHSLTEWRGQTVALFFFCGCQPCQQCASLWRQAQESIGSHKPLTVAVFSGDAAEARSFMAHTHFAGNKTLVLLDTQEQTADRYGVTVCPRLFALNAGGQVRYTNDEPGSDPQKTPTASLVSRMLTATNAASGAIAPSEGQGKHAH